MAGRRCRCGVRRGGSDPRRVRVLRVAVAPAARDPDRDGLLAERQVLHALLDAEHRPHRGRDGPLDRRRPDRPRAHRRVLRRRVRQQDLGFDPVAHSGAALAQGGPAGHDARDTPGRELLRARPAGHPGPRQVRVQERRTDRRHRSDDGPGRRPVRAVGRLHVVRRPGLADVSAGPHARARHDCLHQHASAWCAARAGRRAGGRDVRTDRRQGCAAARHRPARHRPPQRAAGAGAVRSPAAGAAGQRFRRLPEGSHRQGARGVRLGRHEGAQRPAQRFQGDRDRRCDQLLLRRNVGRRRPAGASAGRHGRDSHRRRQSRHRVVLRHVARGDGSARHAVGTGRGCLGRHQQAPAVERDPGRQPDDSRPHPLELGGRPWRPRSAFRRSRQTGSAARRTASKSATAASSGGATAGRR